MATRTSLQSVKKRISKKSCFFCVFAIWCLISVLCFIISVGCECNQKRIPALHQAVTFGSVEMVSNLIRKGAPINELDNRGRTPLYLSSLYGNYEIAELLIRNGANVSIQSRWKSAATPLMVAAQSGNMQIVQLLVNNGAMIDEKSKAGNTALHFAAWTMNVEIVKYLLCHGADPNALNRVGNTPLNMEYLHELESKDPYEQIVSLLVDNGASASNVNKFGRTPLHDACEIGNEHAVVFLLDHGANITKGSSHYLAPVELARRNNYPNIVDIITNREKTLDNRGRLQHN